MERCKRLLRGLLLPDWLACIVVPVAFGWVIWQLCSGQEEGWQAYASYGLSAYALVLVCVRIPEVVRAFRTGFADHPAVLRTIRSQPVRRYRAEGGYRTQLGLRLGLAVNLCNAAFHMIMGIVARSLWSGALAGYYLLLTLLRAGLAVYVHRYGQDISLHREWRCSLACGIVLLLMNQALSVVVALVVHRGGGFSYPGIMVYVMAVYAFYAIIHAVWNIVRLRRQHGPVLKAVGMVSFVAALVSLLALETAMLAQFGGLEDPAFYKVMTGITGGVVCALVLATAVWMIAEAAIALRKQGASL